MFRPPPFTELLTIAAIGARGWFVAILLIGLALFAASLNLNTTVEPRAVVFAFFMPLLFSALMGTITLGLHRVRSEAWGSGIPKRNFFVAAFIWNGVLGVVSLVVDRVVLHFKLLPREPFEFPYSMAVVVIASAGMALLAVLPRRGPQ
jgi:small-conductance mechanosensitive channel